MDLTTNSGLSIVPLKSKRATAAESVDSDGFTYSDANRDENGDVHLLSLLHSYPKKVGGCGENR